MKHGMKHETCFIGMKRACFRPPLKNPNPSCWSLPQQLCMIRVRSVRGGGPYQCLSDLIQMSKQGWCPVMKLASCFSLPSSQQSLMIGVRSVRAGGPYQFLLDLMANVEKWMVPGASCPSTCFYSSCVFRPYRNMIGMRSSTKHDRILRAAYDRRDVPCQNAINNSDRSTIAIARSTLGSHL